jgi:hypothetical protein
MLEPELSEPAYLCLRRRSSTFVRQGQSKGENALSKEAADNLEKHLNTTQGCEAPPRGKTVREW